MKTLVSLFVVLFAAGAMADNGTNGANPENTDLESQIEAAVQDCLQDSYDDRATASVPVFNEVIGAATTILAVPFRCLVAKSDAFVAYLEEQGVEVTIDAPTGKPEHADK